MIALGFLALVPVGGAATVPGALASTIPGGAFAFFETASLAELIGDVRGSALLRDLLQSEDFAKMRERDWYKDFESSKKLTEFVLRMSLWEASAKLLGGRVGVAIYPAAAGGDPEMALLLRPAEPSEWLKRRVWSAPLLHLGLRRIERAMFGGDIAVYRTRGDKDKATYFALHNDWLAAASNLELLKKTVVLQHPEITGLGKAGPPIGDEAAYQRMTARMGAAHFGRVFIDTQRVSRLETEAGGGLGLPKQTRDPMLALFIGGLNELMDRSRFAGFALDLEGKQLRFSAGIDARPQEVDERYRIFFSESPRSGVSPLPEVDGLIGGFTLYRQFGGWYRKRGDAFRDSIIPGIEGFQGDVGDILLGQTDGDGHSVIGDRIAFLAAMRDDAGADRDGAALPGFAFVVDLAGGSGADAAIAGIFEAVLAGSRDGNSAEIEWQHGETTHHGVPIKYAQGLSGGRTLSPAVARSGDRLIVSSSKRLCEDLIDKLNGPARPPVAGKDLVFQLRSDPLGSLLESNRKHYFGQLVRDGRSAKQALDDLQHIENLLGIFRSLEVSSSAADGMFQMQLQGQLR